MKQIDLREIIEYRLGSFYSSLPKWLRRAIYNFLNKVLKIEEANKFMETNYHLLNFDFINQFFDDLFFSYQIKSTDRNNIPPTGRLLIIANHPLGGMDGMALLSAVSEVRRDVKIIVNDVLMEVDNLHGVFIPTSVFEKKVSKSRIQKIIDALQKEEAVIIFPAGEVSRLKWKGISDSKWTKSFVTLSRKYKVPVLPIFVEARNSWTFYLAARIYSILGTLLLPHELFNKVNKSITFHIGKAISPTELFKENESEEKISLKLRKMLYGLKKHKKSIYKSEQPIIPETKKKYILEDLEKAEILGETKDGKKIYLCKFETSQNILREIGRLREITFRSVGEGTGKKVDLDKYDRLYYHIVLWDDKDKDIIGSYRIGDVKNIIDTFGIKGLYTNTLFELKEEFNEILEHSIELGRSFLQQKYWGTASLTYLWTGITSYLVKNPQIKYMFGPVSISNDYPQDIKEMLVYYYNKWYRTPGNIVAPKFQFKIEISSKVRLEEFFDGNSYESDFKKMRVYLKERGHSIPVLYRRYVELCDYGGATFADFNIDPDFADCVDGLLILDINKINQESRNRYYLNP
jgi:putative hemolysin